MRLVSSFCAACLALANVVFGAATVTLTSGGLSSINVAANATFPVDVTIALSGTEAASGISGLQFDLTANSAGLIAGAQTIQTGWDSDTVNGLALPGVAAPISTGIGPFGTAANGLSFAGGTPSVVMTLQVTAPAAGGPFTLNATGIACPIFPPAGPIPADIPLTAGTALTITVGGAPCTRTIVGRSLFLNHSFYDGNDGAGVPSGTIAQCQTFNGGVPCSDNSAIPSNIVALLPGAAPIIPVNAPHGVLANYSNYAKGINGIFIDVAYDAGCAALTPGALATAGTLELIESTGRTVNSGYTGANRTASAAVTVAPHPTLPNTDRIKIILPDFGVAGGSTNARWLRVRLTPGGAVSGLAAEDRFYFGLQRCDGYSVTGTNVLVDITDQAGPKPPNAHTTFARAPLNESYDYDRNSLVDITDQGLPKPPNAATSFTCLQLTGVAP